MNEVVVTLNHQQMITAAMVGVRRTVYAIAKGMQATYGGLRPGDPGAFDNHILGAMSEYAVAQWLNLFWDGHVGQIDCSDVGNCVEVRTIRRRELRMIAHDDDSSIAPFVLVLGEPPNFTLLGWLRGSDAKQPKYRDDPAGGRPAFFVPLSDLRPMCELAAVTAASPAGAVA